MVLLVRILDEHMVDLGRAHVRQDERMGIFATQQESSFLFSPDTDKRKV